MYIDEAKKARKRIEDIIVKTPLLHSDIFSKLSSNNVFMKCENLQVTGAYKIRGALNKISQLSKEEKIKGVVCSSAGNHAQGVAYASSILGLESTIVMPKTTPYLKVQSTRNYGGNTVLFSRFGFEPSYKYGIYHKDREKWGDEGFMVYLLRQGALDGITGITDYYGG